MNIGDKLRERRKQLKLTMLEVANKANVSEATVSRWESGDIANMKRDKIVSLAKALEVSPAFIMGWDDEDVVYNPVNNDKSFKLTPREETHINKYRKLDNHSKDVVDIITDKELERSSTHSIHVIEEEYQNLTGDSYIAAYSGTKYDTEPISEIEAILINEEAHND